MRFRVRRGREGTAIPTASLADVAFLLLVEDEPKPVEALRRTVRMHVLNCVPEYDFGCAPGYAERPGLAVVSIKTARTTPYTAYVDVLDEVWMAYFEMWDDEAKRRGYASYDTYRAALTGDDNEIRAWLKPQISLAEPDR